MKFKASFSFVTAAEITLFKIKNLELRLVRLLPVPVCPLLILA